MCIRDSLVPGLVGGYRGLTLFETGRGLDLGLRRPQNARGVLPYPCADVVEFRGHRRDARRRHRAEPLVAACFFAEEVGTPPARRRCDSVSTIVCVLYTSDPHRRIQSRRSCKLLDIDNSPARVLTRYR